MEVAGDGMQKFLCDVFSRKIEFSVSSGDSVRSKCCFGGEGNS